MDIANWAVSRARTDSVKTDVNLEPTVLRIRRHQSRIATQCLLVQCALFVACGAAPESPLTMLGAPGRANANVSVAASGEFVAVAWSGAEPGGSMDIYLSVSANSGEVFSAPVRVNRTPGEARVNGEQPPRVALVPRSAGPPSLVVVWTARATAGTVLLSARSDDGGRTFGASSLVPGTDAPGNRGWQTIGVDPDGNVHVVWLDHRRLAADSKVESTHRHGGTAESGADTSGMAQFSDLYFATLEGPISPMPLTAGVCYCCKTAVAARLGGKYPSGLAARLSGKPSRYRVCDGCKGRDSGRTAACQRGSLDAPGLPRRWAGDGRRRTRPGAHRVADRRDGSRRASESPVPCIVGRRPHLHRADAPSRRRTGEPSADRRCPRRHAAARVGRSPRRRAPHRRCPRVARGDGGNSAPPVFRRDRSVGDRAGVYPAIALTPTTAIVAWTSGSPAESTIAVLRMPAVH